MEYENPTAFLSYVHSDDDHDRGRISKIRALLEGEVRMHTGKKFKIFQDRNDLEWGQSWKERIEDSIDNVTFLIPVVTPSYFNSPACRSELERFKEREYSLGENHLILPIYYLACDQMDDEEDSDTLGKLLRSRQYRDWRELRFADLDHATISRALAELAEDIKSRSKSLAEVLVASRDHSTTIEAKPESLTPPDYLNDDRASYDWQKIRDFDNSLEQSQTLSESLGDYKIYTTEFDEFVDADTFLTNGISSQILDRVAKKVATLEIKHRDYIAEFTSTLNKLTTKTTAFTILVDNSGSLRGKMSALTPWLVLIARLLDEAGVKVQIIGYTTRAWKGGQSREIWLQEGRKPNPGRLNDLRYIRYKNFDDTWSRANQNLTVMNQETILKENIDGEALILGYCELSARPESQKFLIAFSDGAPVDDSTLSVNREGMLGAHLSDSIEYITRTDIRLGAVGLEYDVSKYYGDCGASGDTEEAGIYFFNVVAKLI